MAVSHRDPLPVPAFGREMLQHWWLDPTHTYLNHGTVGATPRAVLAAQQALQREAESHPARFLFRELVDLRPAAERVAEPRSRGRLREAADRVGAFVGARGDDLAFVDNASAGVSSVLRSLALQPGDEIVLHDLAYGAVRIAAEHLAGRAGARVVPFAWPFPVTSADHALDAWTGPLERAIGPRTRLVIVDHVVSGTGLVLPVEALVRVAHERGVPVLVDGAHAPAAIPLDIAAVGADWYVANLHKWAFAPRSCGLLWAAPDRQAGLHPPVLSWGLDEGFTTEFDWTGTRDPSPWLAAPAGLDFITHTLGLAAMREWNHARVVEAAAHLVARWDLRDAQGARWALPPEAMTGCLLTVPLPDAAARRFGTDGAGATALKDRLFHGHRIEAQVLSLRGAPWVRLAAQVYNEAADYERLGDAVMQEAMR
jgi:isopenicillin-N epimerase